MCDNANLERIISSFPSLNFALAHSRVLMTLNSVPFVDENRGVFVDADADVLRIVCNRRHQTAATSALREVRVDYCFAEIEPWLTTLNESAAMRNNECHRKAND